MKKNDTTCFRISDTGIYLLNYFLKNGSTISYLYNAAGQKLRKIVTDLGETGGLSTTEYLDGFQYNNFILQFFSHPEGYVLNTPDRNGDPSFDYVYQYKDHLGNIRMNFVFDPGDGSSSLPQLKILEENHYYPFGLKHENYNVEKKKMKWETEFIGGEEMELKRVRQVPNSGYQYKYNGKEWQDELGLDWYDYHARNYDPAIGRWMNVDPLSEMSRRWSPYNYAYNSPIRFIDPDGMLPRDTLEEGKENKEEYQSHFIDLEGHKKITEEINTFFTNYFSQINEQNAVDENTSYTGPGGLFAFGLTKRLRHLLLPDAIMLTGEIHVKPILGNKTAKGVIHVLVGPDAGKIIAVDDLAISLGLPTASGEIGIAYLYHTGARNEIKISDFTGTYTGLNLGVDVGPSIGITATKSNIPNTNNTVYSLGSNIGYGYSPFYGIDLNVEYGAVVPSNSTTNPIKVLLTGN